MKNLRKKGHHHHDNEAVGVECEGKLKRETTGKDAKYKLHTSIKSPFLSDIIGFTFGGFSSRFLMLRKHINSLPCYELDKQPFYSWECITIHTKEN